MSAPILEVSGLSKHFGGLAATDNVDLAVAEGEIHALIGPNGAGKTTLIAQLFGELVPEAGRISLAGERIERLPTHARVRRGLARTFQITRLLTDYTALENVAVAVQVAQGHSFRFWGDVRRERRLAEEARSHLERVGLAARAEAPVANLAHGEHKQLELAVALATRPRLLLLDEPAAGLDPEARHALAGLFRTLQAEGMTLVVSSHILAELDQYSTHMLVLRAGRMVEHRVLDAPSAGPPRRLRVAIAAPDGRLGAALAAQPGVHEVVAGEAEASFAWRGDDSARAALLRALLDSGLAVTAFEDSRENLHDSYLRSVEGAP